MTSLWVRSIENFGKQHALITLIQSMLIDKKLYIVIHLHGCVLSRQDISNQ